MSRLFYENWRAALAALALLAILWLFWALASSVAFGADHLVVGLEPDSLYAVLVDGSEYLDGVPSSAAGALAFESSFGTGVHTIEMVLALEIPACPDLVVSRAWFEPDPVECGRALELKAEVENIGTDPAPASSTGFLVQGEEERAVVVLTPALAPGTSVVVSTVLEDWPPVGEYTLSACADAGDEVAEPDEANNCHP